MFLPLGIKNLNNLFLRRTRPGRLLYRQTDSIQLAPEALVQKSQKVGVCTSGLRFFARVHRGKAALVARTKVEPRFAAPVRRGEGEYGSGLYLGRHERSVLYIKM